MFSPHFYPSSRRRRVSQTPQSFFDFLNQSPYNPSYSLQQENDPHDHSSLFSPWRQSQAPEEIPHRQHRFSLPPRYHNPAADAQAQRAQRLMQQRLQREKELEQEARHQREMDHLQNCSLSHQDALRAERARRLAEAQRRQRSAAMGGSMDDESNDPKVEVDLPDGKTCVVPLSWARKMRARYPHVLTPSKIRLFKPPIPEPTPEPEVFLENDQDQSSEHDSDFYALDPSQAPADDFLTPAPVVDQKKSCKPQPKKYSAEELDAAARLIQQQFRIHRRLENLRSLEKRFLDVRSGFNYPSPFELTFQEPPTDNIPHQNPTNVKLAYNNSTNRPVQVFEENLLQLQIDLDGIISGGDERIKSRRKQLIKEVEAELEKLDRFKSEAWVAQCALKAVKSKSSRSQEEQELPTVEMADANDNSQPTEGVDSTEAGEPMNTDTESVKSNNSS